MNKQDEIINIQISHKALKDTIAFMNALVEELLVDDIIDDEFAGEIKSRTVMHLRKALEVSQPKGK